MNMIYLGNLQYFKQEVNGIYLNLEFLYRVSFVNWMLLSKTVIELTSFLQHKTIWFPQEDPKGTPGKRVASLSHWLGQSLPLSILKCIPGHQHPPSDLP